MKSDKSPWFLHASLGAWDPEGCLVSVIDEPTEAARAVAALRTVGFTQDQIRLFLAGEQFAFSELLHPRDFPKQAFFFMINLSDDAQFETEYRHEARQGHPILVVHAPQPEQCTLARELLQRHHAHTIKYYGSWVVTGFD